MTYEEAKKAFMEEYMSRVSASSAKVITSQMRRMEKYCDSIGKAVYELTSSDINKFVINSGLDTKALSRIFSQQKKLIGYLIKNGVCKTNPFVAIRLDKSGEDVNIAEVKAKLLLPSEYSLLIEQLPLATDRVLLWFAKLGLAPQEILKIKISDIKPESLEVVVCRDVYGEEKIQMFKVPPIVINECVTAFNEKEYSSPTRRGHLRISEFVDRNSEYGMNVVRPIKWKDDCMVFDANALSLRFSQLLGYYAKKKTGFKGVLFGEIILRLYLAEQIGNDALKNELINITERYYYTELRKRDASAIRTQLKTKQYAQYKPIFEAMTPEELQAEVEAMEYMHQIANETPLSDEAIALGRAQAEGREYKPEDF